MLFFTKPLNFDVKSDFDWWGLLFITELFLDQLILTV